ncbi:MAG: hypothetical protein ACR2LT_02420 [Pyrinomonadaceae bacterium]
MNDITSTNPVVKAVIEGTAPYPARMAAARGILPISQTDLLEVLVNLAKSDDAALSKTAETTLAGQDVPALRAVIESNNIAPDILTYFAERENAAPEIHEAVISNPQTPDAAIINFARKTKNGDLLELVALNQQRLIRVPALIEAITTNPFRTAEADRRAAETRREFFEKSRGAQQIADELRAQGKTAAAEFIEQAEFAGNLTPETSGANLNFEDARLIAEHIEIPDSEIDDSWLSLEYIEEFYEETAEEREAIVNKILGEIRAEDESVTAERISMISRILRMTMKDRVKLAQKGDREARNILIRDPNRIVAQAVIQNPRITEQEVEKIATMRTVSEDVLRQIAINRAWARNYSIMYKLVQNPRTPLGNSVTIMTRLQLRDLEALVKNKNVPEAIRKQALRLSSARKGR